MLVDIITPDKELFSGNILSIELPGSDGSFEILNNHAPIIATLSGGKITIALENGKKESFEVNGGVVETQNNKIIVLVD
ncbi:ATP synthase F1 subunit epsilon [Flavobacteriales bacterium]|nr:ATP synthase F1 subunit epsilon [Flavobacteriales bacterium]MDG1145772.1 ATP synthase F1 subunit epsilon [Flavobacteriales bacterium]MDG1395586.1 ATP synthase F1 subunit epsilon [Flavobacteriales bacterium]|tara:strand:- start:330 stop:566 length:237 start_codon:yes stop_codon:yes gene_type:complete